MPKVQMLILLGMALLIGFYLGQKQAPAKSAGVTGPATMPARVPSNEPLSKFATMIHRDISDHYPSISYSPETLNAIRATGPFKPVYGFPMGGSTIQGAGAEANPLLPPTNAAPLQSVYPPGYDGGASGPQSMLWCPEIEGSRTGSVPIPEPALLWGTLPLLLLVRRRWRP